MPQPAPKKTSKLMLAVLGCGGLLGLCCVGSFGLMLIGASVDPPTPAEVAAVTSEMDGTFARIHALKDACPSSRNVATVKCDDATIKASHKDKQSRLYIDAVHYASLARFRSRVKEDWTAKRHAMAWMDSVTIRDARRAEDTGGFGPTLGNMRWSIAKLAERRYLAVFRANKEEMPLADGDKFFGGVWDGALFIMDMETAQCVGQAPLHFENSDQVRYRTKGAFQKSFQQACEDDFKGQFQKCATDSLRKISLEVYISSHTTIGD
ncbi:MAG: hypothetical protein ACAI25_17165 [Planctomycetota bacterium]